MMKGEREELKSLTRQRARVAKAGVEARQAAVRADAEDQLSGVYAFSEEDWAAVTAEAQRAVAAADAAIAERCRERGIPEDFRPSLSLAWYGRGSNAVPARRAELRKKAERRIEAEGRAAKLAIDEAALEVLTELASSALTTDEAKAFLQRMPTVVELMPTLDVRELEAGR